MRIHRALPLALVAFLSACAALDGGAVPDELSGLCVGTIQAGGVRQQLNMRLSEIVDQLEATGFAVSRSGGAESGTLNASKDDQFAGKTTTIVFETERHPGPPDGGCKDGLAVLARAKLNGEVLDGYNSQDLVYTLAVEYRKTHPYEPTAEEKAQQAQAEQRQREKDKAAAEEKQAADLAAQAQRAEQERVAAARHEQMQKDAAAREAAFEECDRQRNAAQATKPLEDGYATYRSFECEHKKDRALVADNAKYPN